MRSSLILAAHNEGDLLWRTIESCVQTSAGLQFEVIVADDASWDGSIDEARKRFPQLHVVQQDERTGASPTKDLGARHARGDVVVFLDSHTKPEMGALERLVEDVERLNGAAIITPAIARLDAGRWKTERGHLGYGYAMQLDTLDCRWLPLNGMREHPHRGRLFYESPALIGCAFAIHRDLYEDLRGFDPHMLCWGAEDLDLGLKAWLMGHPVLHDPEAIIGHRFQSRFENFQVPVEQLVANQLRLARKNFTDAVWSEWAERCRARHPGTLADHVEGVWARAWKLFSELRASVEQERSYLLGRRVHDEFWYADRFRLPWPKLQSGDPPATSPTLRSFAAEPAPSPSDFSHHLDAIDDKFSVDSSGIATGNVITAENADDDEGHDTYDGIPIVDTSSFTTTLLQAPQHGSVMLDLHGQFTYTADEGFSGTDSFAYQLLGPGGETDQATVNILSADSTDHEPTFPGDYSVDVPEDTPIDSIIITVQATDPDGDPLAYSLIGGNDDVTFAIHETTGVITLVQPLDYETKKIYTLTVKAMDTSGLSGTANVVVHVTDVNEPPVVPPMTYSVDDGAQADTFVGTITAFDPDGEPITTYSILEQKGIDGGNVEHAIGSYFRIEKDPDTDDAYIYVAEGITIDYAAYHSFRIKIEAYVIAGQFGREWSTINVHQPTNTPPVFDLIETYDTDEDAAIGFITARVHAVDEEDGQATMYTIIGGSGVAIFAIDNLGTVTVNDSLANCGGTDFDLLVRAFDTQLAFADTTLVISVLTAANANDPVIKLEIYNGQYKAGDQPVANKASIGAFTVANKNDTNGNGVADWQDTDGTAAANGRDELDLMRLVIRRPEANPPADAKMTLRVVSLGGRVQLWTTNTKGSLFFPISVTGPAVPPYFLTRTYEFRAALIPADGVEVWAEAPATSSSMRDISFDLTYSEAAGRRDSARATAIWAEKVSFIASQVVTTTRTNVSGRFLLGLTSTAGLKPGDKLLVYPVGGGEPDKYQIDKVETANVVLLTTALVTGYPAGQSVRVGYPPGVNSTSMINTFLGGRTPSGTDENGNPIPNYTTGGFLGTNGSRYNSMYMILRLLPAGIGQAVRNRVVKVDITRQRQEVTRWAMVPAKNEDEPFPILEEAFNDDTPENPDEDTDCSAGGDMIYVRDMPGTPLFSNGSAFNDDFIQLANMQEFVRVQFGKDFPVTGKRKDNPIGSRASDYVPWHSLLHVKATGPVIPKTGWNAWVRVADNLNAIGEGNINPDANGRGIPGSLEELLP